MPRQSLPVRQKLFYVEHFPVEQNGCSQVNAFAFAFLSVIPKETIQPPMRKSLCLCFSVCHSRRESAVDTHSASLCGALPLAIRQKLFHVEQFRPLDPPPRTAIRTPRPRIGSE